MEALNCFSVGGFGNWVILLRFGNLQVHTGHSVWGRTLSGCELWVQAVGRNDEQPCLVTGGKINMIKVMIKK